MALFRVPALPEDALAAAAAFHAEVLPDLLKAIGGKADHLTMVFTPAGHAHRGWRLAAVQELARSAAPVRVNALESEDETAIAAAAAYCANAPGLTGQMLPLDAVGGTALQYRA